MIERPIIMSGPMVRAILDGRKTQTRRVLNIRGHKTFSAFGPSDTPGYDWHFRDAEMRWHDLTDSELKALLRFAPGDLLWVKEGWAEQHPCAVQPGRDHRKGRAGIPGPPSVTYRVIYREEGPPLQVWRRPGHPYFSPDGPDPDDAIAADHPVVLSNFSRDGKGIHWGSARYMPRQFSRLTLRVTDIRVQRLQDISEADAQAEGVMGNAGGAWGCEGVLEDFEALWDSLNAKRGHGWDTDPWVVAVSFEAVAT